METDVLVALVTDDDWQPEPATEALDTDDDLDTSILAHAELIVRVSDREESGYDVDVARVLAKVLALVPVKPTSHGDAVLAAATSLEEYELTPLDALQAGVVTTPEDSVLSTERDYGPR